MPDPCQGRRAGGTPAEGALTAVPARAMDGAERRRALRELARRHHPDHGGDLETYLREVAALGRPGRRPIELRQARLWRRAARRLHRRTRAWWRERQRRRGRRVDLG